MMPKLLYTPSNPSTTVVEKPLTPVKKKAGKRYKSDTSDNGTPQASSLKGARKFKAKKEKVEELHAQEDLGNHDDYINLLNEN